MILPWSAPPFRDSPAGAHRHFHTGYIHIKRRFGPKNLQESLFFSQRRSAEKHRSSPSILPSQTTFAANYPKNRLVFFGGARPHATIVHRPARPGDPPSTFHITESDQFLGHLPSKNDLFFEALRPHAAVVRQIHRHRRLKVSSRHIPYHRVESILLSFTLKK